MVWWVVAPGCRHETKYGRTVFNRDRQAVGWPARPPYNQRPVMSIPRSVATILGEHLTLELESIDRM
jgi:hypothetical protein